MIALRGRHGPFFVHKNIFRLEVTVRNFLIVNVFHTYKNLLHVIFNLSDGNRLILLFMILNDLLKIVFTEFKY